MLKRVNTKEGGAENLTLHKESRVGVERNGPKERDALGMGQERNGAVRALGDGAALAAPGPCLEAGPLHRSCYRSGLCGRVNGPE